MSLKVAAAWRMPWVIMAIFLIVIIIIKVTIIHIIIIIMVVLVVVVAVVLVVVVVVLHTTRPADSTSGTDLNWREQKKYSKIGPS